MIGVLVDILKYSLKREVVCENAGAIARILEVGRPSVVQSIGAFFMGLVIRNEIFLALWLMSLSVAIRRIVTVGSP